MNKVVVFHHHNLNGYNTTFEGYAIEAIVQNDGCLCITRWLTETEKGYAVFAPGQWLYFCYSESKT